MLVSFGLWRFVLRDFRDFTKVSLDRSPYLRDVAEPITLISARWESASDQIWRGVVLLDAKHVERYAEYVTASYAPVEMHHTLILGKQPVPASGPEERAFLGLLQRWYQRDAEARELTDHLKREDVANLTERQQAKVVGASIMRSLLARNFVP
jgi:hypothetical protein